MKPFHKIEAIVVWGLLIISILMLIFFENKKWVIIPWSIIGILELLYEEKRYKKDK